MSTPPRPQPTRSRTPGTPARPPFGFSVDAPAGWEVLRGDAPSLADDLLALVARTPVWQQLDDRRRGGLGFLLHGIARASASTGALVTLLRLPTVPATPGDDPEVATISLTWLRTTPVRADLDLAGLVLRGGEPVATGIGPALVDRRTEDTVTGGVQVTVQVAAPVPQSVWMAVLTGTTTSPAYAPGLDEAVLSVAAGLTVDRPAPAAVPTP